MALCTSCTRLREATSDVKPHPSLAREYVRRQPVGTLERFGCTACGAAWERYQPRPHLRGLPHYWKII